MSMKKKKDNNPMPASQAGLLRFFEDETPSIKIRPEFVIGVAVALMVVSILARLFLPII